MTTNTQVIENRPYQNRVIENTLKAIEDGHTNILIVSPTGSGKTVMGHEIARRLHEKFGWKYGWTCMRINLVAQAKLENAAKFGLDYGTYFSSFTKKLPTGIDLLIEDEAQHSASETATTLNTKIGAKVHIALTATPYRTDRMKLCFSKVIQDAGLRQLVDEGWLAPYNLYIHPMAWTPDEVAQTYLKEPDKWGKSLVFFLTRADCWKCQELLEAGGISCDVVEGGDAKAQERKIRAFHEGETQVLINVFVLTEGFDAPELKTVFVRPGSKGPTIQMAGRVYRKYADHPIKNVVQNAESLWPMSQVVSPTDKLVWDETIDSWVSRMSEHKAILDLHMKSMLAIQQAPEANLGDWLVKRNRKTRGWRNFGTDADGNRAATL